MLNKKYLSKLARSLYSNASEAAQFEAELINAKSEKNAIVYLNKDPLKQEIQALLKEDKLRQSFFDFTYTVSSDVKLSSMDLHTNGDIYCLDNSSIFAATIFKAIKGDIFNILDECAAPGGKAILAWRNFNPKLLVANETVNKRIPMLISNLKRCKIANSAVSSLDSKILAEKYNSLFCLVIVDAPCSGQSLIVKGETSPGALNPATINLNSNRQKRILANASKCVKASGYLAYMTCTYSIEENEHVVKWFLKKFPEFKTVEVQELETFRTIYSEDYSYRLFPQSGLGVGSFTTLFKRDSEEENSEEFPSLENEKFIWKSF